MTDQESTDKVIGLSFMVQNRNTMIDLFKAIGIPCSVNALVQSDRRTDKSNLSLRTCLSLYRAEFNTRLDVITI